MIFFKKYKQTILYLIFGVLSTIVNIVTYVVCTRNLNIEFLISNWIAWIAAVLFAYITNKFFVFESKKTNIKEGFIKKGWKKKAKKIKQNVENEIFLIFFNFFFFFKQKKKKK